MGLLIIIILLNLILVTVGFVFTKKLFKNKTLRIAIWAVIFLVLSYLELLGLGFVLGYALMRVEPKKIFYEFFAKPIPKNVTIIEGGGFSWLGYRLYLVFTADKTTIEGLLAKYSPRPDCSKIDPYMKTTVNIKEEVKGVFKKEDITKIPNLTCYYDKKILDEHEEVEGQKIYHEEEIYIFWDKARNKVFFLCSGGS